MQYAMRYKDVQASRRPEVFNASDPTRYVHAKITCEPVQLGDSGFGDVGRDHLMTKMGQIEGMYLSASEKNNSGACAFEVMMFVIGRTTTG